MAEAFEIDLKNSIEFPYQKLTQHREKFQYK